MDPKVTSLDTQLEITKIRKRDTRNLTGMDMFVVGTRI